ncbi:SRPBCC family protein [Herbidospora sp. RD11066]
MSLLLSVFGAPARATTDPLAQEWLDTWNTYKFTQVANPLPAGRSRASQSISITINAPRAEVFAKYSNFNNHIGANPVLQQVITHSDNTALGRRAKNLTAIEVIPASPAPITLNTHARQVLHLADFFYTVDSWSTGYIVTHQKITFEKVGPLKTKVTENLTFETPTELIDLALSSGVAAHQGIQSGLKQRIESGDL